MTYLDRAPEAVNALAAVGRLPVLSLDNPWAELMFTPDPDGGPVKWIETRSWPCPSTVVGGWLGIASTGRRVSPSLRFGDWSIERGPGAQRMLHDTDSRRDRQLHRGMLLGVVRVEVSLPMTWQELPDGTPHIDLSDRGMCLQPSRRPLGAQTLFGWFESGRHGWICGEERRLTTPIPVEGRQRVWYAPDDIAARAWADLADQSAGGAAANSSNPPGITNT